MGEAVKKVWVTMPAHPHDPAPFDLLAGPPTPGDPLLVDTGGEGGWGAGLIVTVDGGGVAVRHPDGVVRIHRLKTGTAASESKP